MTAADEWLLCSEDGCEAKIKNHAWGKIKAEGWLQLRTGPAYCPDHLPEWYEEWAMRKADERKATIRKNNTR